VPGLQKECKDSIGKSMSGFNFERHCSINLTVCVSLQRAEEMSEALNFAIRYMEAARADLKQLFKNVSPAVSEDELCYRIHEIISLLDVGVEEA
jgi:hypothetical protein